MGRTVRWTIALTAMLAATLWLSWPLARGQSDKPVHWAYVSPHLPPIPGGAHNPAGAEIPPDNFVLAKLEARRLYVPRRSKTPRRSA